LPLELLSALLIPVVPFLWRALTYCFLFVMVFLMPFNLRDWLILPENTTCPGKNVRNLWEFHLRNCLSKAGSMALSITPLLTRVISNKIFVKPLLAVFSIL